MYLGTSHLLFYIYVLPIYLYVEPTSFIMGYRGETRDINSVEVHPELSHNGHPMDGALAGACSLWPKQVTYNMHVKDFVITKKCTAANIVHL